MMERQLLSLVPAIALWALVAAQTTPPPTSAATGSITGHVFCADTNLPARFAKVLIVPIPATDEHGKQVLPKVTSGNIAKTDLDGAYIISKVAPGDYFVLAEMDGYISPVVQFSMKELQHPAPETVQQLARLMPSVHVLPGRTAAAAQISLEHGASISGTVTYDDGSPAVDLFVNTQAQDVNSQAMDHNLTAETSMHGRTDDRGNYRIYGLPGGKFIVVTMFVAMPPIGGNELSGEGESIAYTYEQGGHLQIYYGDTLHRREAKSVEVRPGEDRAGVDITISLDGLHRVSGRVAAGDDAHPAACGFVSLTDVNDKSFLRRTVVFPDGTFHFDYIPNGKYTLKAMDIVDVIPPATGDWPDSPYGETESSITLHDIDVNNVTISVHEMKKVTAHQ